ncbi:MAG: four helix bundle protein [Candidatus Pacebacteria bacterium]|nr:four helix bundle protein [Candidatus Paceibacterota bacterium]
MTIRTFKDLDVWKQGHALVLAVYRQTHEFPSHELFALTNQMRRAAVSITSNIAEGFGRQGEKDKVHFYVIAKGSLYEIQSQLQIALDLGYLTVSTHDQLEADCTRVAQLLHGLIRSVNAR